MKTIRYGVHFALLAVAAVVIWLTLDVDLPASIVNYRIIHLGLPGFLHAICIVLSLRDRNAIRPLRAAGFVGLAALWSAWTPIMGMWASVVWWPITAFLPPSPNNFNFILLTGSATGAAGYWLLVRWFWIRSLRRMDLLRTVTLCVSATLLVAVYGFVVPSGFSLTWPKIDEHLSDLFLTGVWWFAFSISLYWSETKIPIRKRDIAMVIASVVLLLGGTALTQYALDARVKDDRERLADLKSIAAALHEDWKDARGKTLEWHAPAALKDASKALQDVPITDPVTKVPYDYRPLSGSKYQLARFSTMTARAKLLARPKAPGPFRKGGTVLHWTRRKALTTRKTRDSVRECSASRGSIYERAALGAD